MDSLSLFPWKLFKSEHASWKKFMESTNLYRSDIWKELLRISIVNSINWYGKKSCGYHWKPESKFCNFHHYLNELIWFNRVSSISSKIELMSNEWSTRLSSIYGFYDMNTQPWNLIPFVRLNLTQSKTN